MKEHGAQRRSALVAAERSTEAKEEAAFWLYLSAEERRIRIGEER
jgi:hypothetical protein